MSSGWGDFIDKRDARAKLGKALAARGWTLYGWKDDQSELQVDYFDPADWRPAIATKGEDVVVVDLPAGHVDVERLSGQPQYTTVREPGAQCERCSGSGDDPCRWTMEQARAHPKAFNRALLQAERGGEVIGPPIDGQCGPESVGFATASGSIHNPMGDVVSPLHFNDGGLMKCVACHGRGHAIATRREYAFTWPTFQGNPPRKKWHVERAGVIVASGMGLKPAKDDPEPIAERIDNATQQAATSGSATAELRENDQRGGLELVFSAKPSPEVRQQLKANGWRWSRRQGLWYTRRSEAQRRFAERLIGAEPASASPEP
jgi:hypothetical protein